MAAVDARCGAVGQPDDVRGEVMSEDDVIRMASEAGFERTRLTTGWHRFAALIRNHTLEEAAVEVERLMVGEHGRGQLAAAIRAKKGQQ